MAKTRDGLRGDDRGRLHGEDKGRLRGDDHGRLDGEDRGRLRGDDHGRLDGEDKGRDGPCVTDVDDQRALTWVRPDL